MREPGIVGLRAVSRRGAAAHQYRARREGRPGSRPPVPAARRSARGGCTVEDLATGRVTAPVRTLLAFECERAREYYRKAVAVRPESDRRRLVAAEIMRAVYSETLGRIERGGYDVFAERVRVPKPLQAVIALRQWLFQR